MEYTINRKIKGTRTFFYPTKDGLRFNNINYARKYDAKNCVKAYINKYGAAKLEQMFKEKAAK